MKATGDKEKMSVKQYLNKNTPYLYDLINDHRIVRRVWKIQINMHVNFISSINPEETRIYYACSDNLSIMQGSETDDIIRKNFRLKFLS